MTAAQLVKVGKAIKGMDPEMVTRMRRDGYTVGAKAVAQYVREVDPDQFVSVVDYLVEEGHLPEGLERTCLETDPVSLDQEKVSELVNKAYAAYLAARDLGDQQLIDCTEAVWMAATRRRSA